MKRGIRFSSIAWAHYSYWMVQDKATLRRIDQERRMARRLPEDALEIAALRDHCGA